MLKFTAIIDKKLLDAMHMEIFGGAYPKDVGYVLFDGETPIGIAQMTVKTDVSKLEEVGILPEYRKKRNGDFFTRSLIWGLSQACEKVEIGYKSPYFTKFGFKEENNGMSALSKDIVFPCECHK